MKVPFFLFAVLLSVPAARAADPAPAVGATEMPKGYEFSEESVSPDGKYGVIYANSEVIDTDVAVNFLVSSKPFRILARNAGFSYYKPGNHREMHVEWTTDSSTALLMIGDKWGTIGATLFELKDGKVTRSTDIMASINVLLQKEFPAGKVTPYNDIMSFVLEEEKEWKFSDDGKTLSIDVVASNSPNLAGKTAWRGTFQGVWDVAAAKWLKKTAKGEVYERTEEM